MIPKKGAAVSQMEITTYCKCACANCGEVIDYRTSQAGQTVECPKCREKSQLPEPDKLLMIEVEGPPIPPFKNCSTCDRQIKFLDPLCSACETVRKRKLRMIQFTVCASVILLLGAGWAVMRHRAKTATAQARLLSDSAKAAAPPRPRILMEQPRLKSPKSTNDLRPGRFVLEQRRGSDLAIAVGDIENVSENVHLRLRADLDLLDKSGTKIGTVSDYFTELGPHQSWHFNATVTATNAMSLRFAGIKED